MTRPLLLVLVLCAAAAADAQTPGAASFRVYESGALVGSVEMTLERSADGWRLHGRSRIGGSVPVAIANLDLRYDARWRPTFMTLDQQAPEDVIVQVAVLGATTRTDIMRPDRVRHRDNSISPDTIFLPDRAFGAYEAVAARLGAAGAEPGTTLPLFIVPEGETRAVVERVTAERVTTESGLVLARRYELREIRDGMATVDIWVERRRLLRLDVPRWNISIVRSDVR